MSLANKVFRNNKTGENIRVIDSFENIAILENKQKIDVTQLMDPNQFTEQIDPSSFFNNQDAYNALTEKIKSIPINNIVDESGDVVSINVDGDNSFRPAMEESAIIMSSEEDEMAELARKYGATLDNGDALNKQQAAFDKLLNPEKAVEEQPVMQVVVNNEPTNMPGHSNPPQPPVQRIEVEDPIITMFKRTKRNVNFNVNVEISDKIPRLDFIEMMEDSYEISMIDFLADEFTNKILSDPSQIRETIKEKIKQLVYGSPSIPKKDTEEVSESVKVEETTGENVVKKPRAKRTTKNVPEPPKPPASRMLKEGKEPEKPKNV